jgi:hypothetical protein
MNLPFPAEVEKKKVESFGIIAFILILDRPILKGILKQKMTALGFT